MDTIGITGHRNPDTDSIVAAMAYAALQNPLRPPAPPVEPQDGPLYLHGAQRHLYRGSPEDRPQAGGGLQLLHDFLLGQHIEGAVLLHGLQLVQPVHAGAHGLEVGHHAAQPAGVDKVHVAAGGLFGCRTGAVLDG